MKQPSPRLVLASTSPRRREILSLLGLPFEIAAPLYEEESLQELSPYEEALRFALDKAKSLRHAFAEAILLGSDTLIEFEGRKIGKPKNAEDARRILNSLQGKTHDVLTGVALLHPDGAVESGVEITQIQMRDYCDDEIEAYVQSGEGLDKAGAYALQGRGRFLIEGLQGDYLSAVGLPLRFVAEGLEKFGVMFPVSAEKIYQEKNFLNWKSYIPKK